MSNTILSLVGKTFQNFKVTTILLKYIHRFFGKQLDRLDHNLCLSKLSAFGFVKEALNLIYCFKKNRIQFLRIDWLSIFLMKSLYIQVYLIFPIEGQYFLICSIMILVSFYNILIFTICRWCSVFIVLHLEQFRHWTDMNLQNLNVSNCHIIAFPRF